MGHVRLELPARPEYVGVIRLALASLARQAGLEEERVDDLKIAVSEICTDVVSTESSGVINIGWDSSEGSATIEVVAPISSGETRDFSRALVEALLDGCEVEETPESRITRMRIT